MDVDLAASFRSKTLLTQLENYVVIDEREYASLLKIRELLSSSTDDDVFDQTLSSSHITGSAFVVSLAGLLLHFHKKIPLWLQPGGHLDGKETALEAAKRETLEETGVVAEFEQEIFHIDVHDTPSGHQHFDIRYVAHAKATILRPPLGESQKVAWFSPSALTTITDPALVGAIAKLVVTGKFLVSL